MKETDATDYASRGGSSATLSDVTTNDSAQSVTDGASRQRLGRLIQIRRQDIGLSQRQFAEAMKVGLRTVGAWERGETAIKPRVFAQIQTTLRCRFEVVGGVWQTQEPSSVTVASHAVDEGSTAVTRAEFDLPPGALDGLDDLEISEVMRRAEAAALKAIREIRGGGQ